jgi:chromosome transmission fidelity protein 4
MSRSDWENQRKFASGHMGDILAIAWSPNGALLVTAGADRKVLLWETRTQNVLTRYSQLTFI